MATSPPPDGSPPLRWTATCEHCRPRRALPFEDQEERDRWIGLHYADRGHRSTAGTMRARTPRSPVIPATHQRKKRTR